VRRSGLQLVISTNNEPQKKEVTEEIKTVEPMFSGRDADLWPVLTDVQMARIGAHGRQRKISAGEVLAREGDLATHLFVITAGEVELIRPSEDGPELIAIYTRGKFTGEINMLSGRRGFVTIQARTDGEVIEVTREELLSLVQTDSDLSDILMRAFLLRRLELIAHGFGDVILMGSLFCAATLRIKEFLTRNNHPYSFVDLDEDAGTQELLDRFHIDEGDIPVLICRGQIVLRNPQNHEIAEVLGFNETIDSVHLRDLLIIGAGPSGLAAAVYGASEGLDVLVLESDAPGGQAGSSSKIENYLGFPTGISGQELASAAYAQAQKFGAQVLIDKASSLKCDRKPYKVEIDGGQPVSARTIIIATGAAYRRPPINNLSKFEGVGVYYGATPMEAQLAKGQEVIIVGGGNAAGQASVFLANTSSKVNVLVRAKSLAQSMSRYLIRRLEDNPNIDLLTETEVVTLEGNGHLERVSWRRTSTGEVTNRDIRHVFMMTGAVPCTSWLGGCLILDDKGFIKTGPALSREDLDQAKWPVSRNPHLLETSLPGVFAVGDVRGGNLKRVASAVGEGAIAVAFVHQVLSE